MIEMIQALNFLLTLGCFVMLVGILLDSQKPKAVVRNILGKQEKRAPKSHDDDELWRREQDAKRGEPR